MSPTETRKTTGFRVARISAANGQYIRMEPYSPYPLDELVTAAETYAILPEDFRKNCRDIFEGKNSNWKLQKVDVFTSSLLLVYVGFDDLGAPERIVDLIVNSPISIGLNFYRSKTNRRHQHIDLRYRCCMSSSGEGGTHSAEVLIFANDEKVPFSELTRRELPGAQAFYDFTS